MGEGTGAWEESKMAEKDGGRGPGGGGCYPALSHRIQIWGGGDRFRVEHPELGLEYLRR